MFVYRPDQFEDEGLCNQDIRPMGGAMEILRARCVQFNIVFATNDSRVRRFREVLRGPIGVKTAYTTAKHNTYYNGNLVITNIEQYGPVKVNMDIQVLLNLKPDLLQNGVPTVN